MAVLHIRNSKGIEVKVDPDKLDWVGDNRNDTTYKVAVNDCPGGWRVCLETDSATEIWASASAHFGDHWLSVCDEPCDGTEILLDDCVACVVNGRNDELTDNPAVTKALRPEIEIRDEPDKTAQREAIDDWLAALPPTAVWRIDRLRSFANEWDLWCGEGGDPLEECGDGAERVDAADVADLLMSALANEERDNYRTVLYVPLTNP